MNKEYEGVGIDIEEVGRFRRLPHQRNPAFYKKIFTDKEIKYCLSKNDPYPHFAGKFAAKEAVSKALNQSVYKAKTIEILNGKDGAPVVKIQSASRWTRFKIYVSISHTKDYAVAMVLIK